MSAMLDFAPAPQSVSARQDGLFDRALLLSVRFEQWGRSRKLATQEYTLTGETDQARPEEKRRRTRAGKTLMAKVPEIEAIQALYSETRAWLDARRLPSPIRGVYLWPIATIEEATAYLDGAAATLSGLIGGFGGLVARWSELVAVDMAALAALGDIADARDYPWAHELHSLYRISYLPPFYYGTSGAYQAQAAQVWQDAVASGVAALTEELSGLLGHMVDKLTPGPDGQARKYHKTLTSNIDDWVKLFGARSAVLGSPELDAVVAEVGKLMSGVDVDVLKASEAQRDVVARRAAEIRDALAQPGMVVPVPTRKLAVVTYDDI